MSRSNRYGYWVDKPGMSQMVDALSTRSLREDRLVRGRKHGGNWNLCGGKPLKCGDVCYRIMTRPALTDMVRDRHTGGDNTEQEWGQERTGISRSCPFPFQPPLPKSGPTESLSEPRPQPRPLTLRKTDRKRHQLSSSSFQEFHLISLEGAWKPSLLLFITFWGFFIPSVAPAFILNSISTTEQP